MPAAPFSLSTVPGPSSARHRHEQAGTELDSSLTKLNRLEYVSPFSGNAYKVADVGPRTVKATSKDLFDTAMPLNAIGAQARDLGQGKVFASPMALVKALHDPCSAALEETGCSVTPKELMHGCKFDPREAKFKVSETHGIFVGEPTIGQIRSYYTGRRGAPQPAGTFTDPSSARYQGPEGARAAKAQYEAHLAQGHHDGLAPPGAFSHDVDNPPSPR
eukprot:254236_1